MNINHTRDLVRMGNAFYDSSTVTPERRTEDLQRLSLTTWAFVRAMKRHLSPEKEDEAAFRAELYAKLPEAQAEAILKASHRPNRALFDLSVAIENLPMHFMRKNQIHKACTIFEDNLGSSERLLTSPVPLFYSRHTARFLSSWLLLLPFALYDTFADSWNHVGLIPATFLISLFLFGIEELATQMEEPFTILPMQAFCDKIGNWCNEIVSWEAGDNDTPVYQGSAADNAVYFELPEGNMARNNKPMATRSSPEPISSLNAVETEGRNGLRNFFSGGRS
jgi:putative membrane protein